MINPETSVVLYMYDDRGLDMIAATREALMPIYRTFNDWVLGHDRERIAKALSE